MMRVAQVANFYGPRSGGLRTAVDRLGAEYCAAGHEVFLIVPGHDATAVELPSGVVRITVPARKIPFTGGYRAVMPAPVTRVLDRLAPDAIEVSDRFTLRSLGSWGARRTRVRCCWCTVAGCQWRSGPTAASMPLRRCAIRVSMPAW
jgi:alpha-1,6-mannosyltransferase